MLTADEIKDCRKAAVAIYIATTPEVAQDISAKLNGLCDHIAAQSEQLRQVQAEGALTRQALLTAQGCVRPSPPESYMRGIFSLADLCLQQINSALSSPLAITAYAARVARMEEALRAIRDHDPETCDGIASKDCIGTMREIARAALEGDG